MKRLKSKIAALAALIALTSTASAAMAAPPGLIMCQNTTNPGGQTGLVVAPVPPYLGKAISPETADWDNGYESNFAGLNAVFPNGFKFRDSIFPAKDLHVHVNGVINFSNRTIFIGPLGFRLPDTTTSASPQIVPFYSDVNLPAEWMPPEEQDNSNIFICVDKANKRLIVTWYYVRKKVPQWEYGTPKEWERNTFQAVLKNSSSSCASSDHVLDVEFRYNKVEWHRWGANSTTDALMGIDLGPGYGGMPTLDVDYKQLWYTYPNYFNILTDSTPSDAPQGVHRFRLVDGRFASAAAPVCGDGEVDSCSEECDLGANNSATGACTTTCKNARCGDGLVQIGVEPCDIGAIDPAFASCPAGYTGTPLCKNHPQNPNKDGTCTLSAIPDGCTDVNECTQTPGICGQGTCANTLGSYSCTCPTGQTFDGTTCVAVNECTTTIAGLQHDCQGDSTCVDTAEGFECTCPAGKVYNGVECSDTDNCADTTLNVCEGTSVCVNTVDGVDCVCPAGYLFHGSDCEDIDECTESAENPCKDTATCINTPGSFRCECETGYAYIDEVCEEVPECTEAEMNSCQGTSTCVNTSDGHVCVCDTGFEYDGEDCVDVDECADASLHTCDENAVCTNTAGGFACVCPEGFLGDGHTCTKSDTPTTPTLPTEDPKLGPIMGGGIACSSAPGPIDTSWPAAIALGLAGLFMVKRRRS